MQFYVDTPDNSFIGMDFVFKPHQTGRFTYLGLANHGVLIEYIVYKPTETIKFIE